MGCDYCNAAHTALAKRHKLEEAEIAANREGRSTDALPTRGHFRPQSRGDPR
ncbi:hypothetical protein F1D61_33160 (plasmid) [Methylobacterium aquaticum]|nr:hypothetical protein F1D61_33160 [Methylobacterium aquaticum]